MEGPGPLGRTSTFITAYVYEKTKISKENLQVNYYLLLKYCRRQCVLRTPTWAKSLAKFNTKLSDLKRVLDLN